MRPLLLHLDEALAAQPRLRADAAACGGIEADGRVLGPALRLWARDADLLSLDRLLDEALVPATGPVVAFYGSGDFHHVAAPLIARAAQEAGPVTVIHVDNHPDWVRFRGGMHCGSWVSRAARSTGVARVLTVGPCSSDLRQPWRKGADLGVVRRGGVEVYPLGSPAEASYRVAGATRPTIAALGEAAFLDLLVARVPTEAVYITIDKDALRADEAVSNWDQGGLTLGFVVALVARLGRERRIVGADVCGDWSAPAYGGTRVTRARKRIESWLDQPRTPPAPSTLAVNEAANRTLLATFREAA